MAGALLPRRVLCGCIPGEVLAIVVNLGSGKIDSVVGINVRRNSWAPSAGGVGAYRMAWRDDARFATWRSLERPFLFPVPTGAMCTRILRWDCGCRCRPAPMSASADGVGLESLWGAFAIPGVILLSGTRCIDSDRIDVGSTALYSCGMPTAVCSVARIWSPSPRPSGVSLMKPTGGPTYCAGTPARS